MKLQRLGIFLILTITLTFTVIANAQQPTPLKTPPEVQTASAPLSLDHILGVYTFSKALPNTFINGFIQFMPDHQWTLVIHFDDDRDRITDRHEVLRGQYYVTVNQGVPSFVLEEKGKGSEAITKLEFIGRKVETFTARGFDFQRKKHDAPYFDHALNVPATAGSLKIETDPPGAAVYLSGVRVQGNTPLTIEKPPAGIPVTLKIQMHGHSPKTDTFTLKEGEAATKSYNLVSGESELWIATKPFTKVYLDGVYKGNSPIKLKSLKAGQHKVRLFNSGANIEETFEVDLPEGEIVKKIIKYTGTLDIFVGKEAKIIDRKGKVIGKAPMQKLELPVGNHSLRLDSGDKKLKIITVHIKLDEVTTFNKDWETLQDWED